MSVVAILRSPEARPGAPSLVQSLVRASDGCRWSLGYLWEVERPVLPWIMLNPALAGTARTFDLTARRVIRFSHRWGFGGALLLNVIPHVSPDPADLVDWLDFESGQRWDRRDMLWRNWRVLRDDLSTFDAAMVAWGNSLARRMPLGGYGWDCLLESAFDSINDPDSGLRTRVLDLWCLGLNGDGSPKHPMARGRARVPDEAIPRPYPRQPGTIVGLGEAA